MKKSTLTLFAIPFFAILGTIMAFKSLRYSQFNYFTTQVSGATATKTLTHALTVPTSWNGNFRYYTLADNAKATKYSKIVADEMQ